jgi:hypothetical protein
VREKKEEYTEKEEKKDHMTIIVFHNYPTV